MRAICLFPLLVFVAIVMTPLICFCFVVDAYYEKDGSPSQTNF
jgi:hypothetical protein